MSERTYEDNGEPITAEWLNSIRVYPGDSDGSQGDPMTELQRRALARVPLDERCVADYYAMRDRHHNDWWEKWIGELCESHERLRAELQGATELLRAAEQRAEEAGKWADERVDLARREQEECMLRHLNITNSQAERIVDMENEICNVVDILSVVSVTLGDNDVFNHCRSRLRKLIATREGTTP